MTEPITLRVKRGMTNLPFAGDLVDAPSVVVNADVVNGKAVKRTGMKLWLPLAGTHSLFAGTQRLLAAANGVIYDVTSGSATTLTTYGGPGTEPVAFEEVDGTIYASNLYWCGTITEAGEYAAWGISQPNVPVVSASASGNLPAGTYHVVLTNISGDLVGGASAIARITLTTTGGIAISNVGTAHAWVTEPNGSEFFYIGCVPLVAQITSAEPLPTLLCHPPLPTEHICYAFGRMWGSRGSRLYYSEPLRPDLWRDTENFFEFGQNITLIARAATGLFVGGETTTFSLMGRNPSEMVQTAVGSGSIRGSLCYADSVRELGDTISPDEKVHNSVPVWLTADGFVVGNASGRLFNLTGAKLDVKPQTIRAATISRRQYGLMQIMGSWLMQGQGDGNSLGFGDEMVAKVIRNGQEI